MGPVSYFINGTCVAVGLNFRLKRLWESLVAVIDHIKIFSGILIFLAGAWTAFYAFQKAREDDFPFLRPMAWYTLLFNLVILGLIIARYSELNLPQELQLSRYHFATKLVELAGTLLVTGLIYLMGQIVISLLGRNPPRLFVQGTVLFSALLAISYLFKLILIPEGVSIRWLEIFHSLIFNNLILLEIPIVMVLLIAGMVWRDHDRRRIIRSLALLLGSRYMLAGVLAALFLTTSMPDLVHFVIGQGTLLYIAIIPFLWLRYFLPVYSESLLRRVDDHSMLNRIYEQYNISPREQEIVRLLLDGKSNKEIKKALFISYHTVKNHIYSIYQKFGINTRYELVHFLLGQRNTTRAERKHPVFG